MLGYEWFLQLGQSDFSNHWHPFEGVYHYKVDSTEVVEPTRTDVLAPTGSPTLTLVTCYPFHMVGPAPKRFIVRGRFIQGETLSAAKQGTGSEQPSEQTASPALP